MFCRKIHLKAFFPKFSFDKKKTQHKLFFRRWFSMHVIIEKTHNSDKKTELPIFLIAKVLPRLRKKCVRCNSAFTLHRVSYIAFIQVQIGELHDTAVIPQTLPIIETLHSTLSWTTWSVKAPRRLIPRSPTRKSEEPFYPRKRPQKKFWFCRKTKKILKKFFAAPGILNTTTVWFIVWFMSMYARVIINRPTCK